MHSISVIAIAVGMYHSLAAREDGTVWQWGVVMADEWPSNNTDRDVLSPEQVAQLDGIVSVAAGFRFSLALKRDGTVWAWGLTDYGQLGDGSSEREPNLMSVNVPVQVQNLNQVIAISAGRYHSLALREDGSVWMWGRQNTLTSDFGSHIPVQLWPSILRDITAISCSQIHSLALRSDGAVLAWGWNLHGELGIAQKSILGGEVKVEPDEEDFPVQLSNLPKTVSISAGVGHNLVVDVEGGVWAWGENEYGQLGDGTTKDTHKPVRVQGITNPTVIEASGEASLALDTEGKIWIWGYQGPWGEADKRHQSEQYTPSSSEVIPAQSFALKNGVALASHVHHSLFLRNDGIVFSWGNNYGGSLGDGTTTVRESPVQVVFS